MSDDQKAYMPLPPPERSIEVTEDLKESQQGMLKALLEHFGKVDYKLPKVASDGELLDQEKFWLSRECLLRYLRASKWVQATAIQRLEDTLRWRREFGLYDKITPEYIEPEGLTGKCVIYGYDVDGRPALYLLPSRQNTEESDRQVEFTVFMLERCMDLMAPGVESLALLIDYADKAKNPSLSLARKVLNILQSHYPERLGRAMILNVPFLLKAFYSLITPLIDPVTRTKMRFNPQAVQDGLFVKDQITKSWGGDVDMGWDHGKYWPTLIRLSDEKRTAWMERWRALGGTVGVREWDYKTTMPTATMAKADQPQSTSA